MKIIYICLAIFFVLGSVSHAQNYYGTVQYTKPSTGVTHIVFQEASPDKSFCEALNVNYLRGIRTTCPDCVVEMHGCSKSLNGAYRNIFLDKPMVLPYVSAPHTRIVITGVPMEEALSICHEMAALWRKGMNRDAKCIHNQ